MVSVGRTTVSLAQFGRPVTGQDTTAAWRAALQAGADRLLIPPGRWYIRDWTRLPPARGRRLVGAPGAVVVAGRVPTAEGGGQWVDCTFEGLTFDGAVAQGFAWFGRSSAGLVFQACTVVNGRTSFVNGSGGPVVIDGCLFTQTTAPPDRLDMSVANVHGPLRVQHSVWDFAPRSPAGVLVQVYATPAPGPVTITDNIFLGGRWGGVVDGAIDIEPHGAPGGPVLIARNRITDGSVYLAGVSHALLVDNSLRFTPRAYTRPHAPPIAGYTSASPKPPAGTLVVTGNTLVCDPGPTAAPLWPMTWHGGGAVRTLVLRDNRIQVNGVGLAGAPAAVAWFDPSVTPGWGPLVVTGNTVTVAGPVAARVPLLRITVGAGRRLALARITANQWAVPGTAGVAVTRRAGAPPGSLGRLVLADNTTAVAMPLATADPDTVIAWTAGPNPGFLPPEGLPAPTAAVPDWAWAAGLGVLAAAGAGLWWARHRASA